MEVRKILEQLEVMDRAYFGKDRQKQLKAKIAEGVALLDQKPIDLGKYRHLIGKVYLQSLND